MFARDNIRDRVRKALADVHLDESPEYVPVPWDSPRSLASADIVGLFAERLADYGAHVVRATTDTAREVIAELLMHGGLGTLVVPPAFPEELLPEGPWHTLDEPLTAAELDASDGVVTTVAVGVAVTGTLILDAGRGQGCRALTLLPDYCLCVVRAEQIVSDLPDALELLGPFRSLTLISGPAATGDVELGQVEGVHRPRSLEIVIIEKSA